jgi:hypothetical protein
LSSAHRVDLYALDASPVNVRASAVNAEQSHAATLLCRGNGDADWVDRSLITQTRELKISVADRRVALAILLETLSTCR